jgi:hypothetical protein
MFSAKCANTDCEAPFDYRRGRFYRFSGDCPEDQIPANTHSLQHFWLCDRCSARFTLEFRDGKSILLPLQAERQWQDISPPNRSLRLAKE